MKKVNTKLTYTYRNTHVIEIVTIVGWWGKQLYVKKRRVSFMYFIVDKRIFLLSRNLWFGAHIDTGVIDFLNDSSFIFVEFCITPLAKVAL